MGGNGLLPATARHIDRLKNVKCVRKTEILVEQQSPKGVFICDHAGSVVNKFSLTEIRLSDHRLVTVGNRESALWPYRGTSLVRNRLPLGPYRRPMLRVLEEF